MKKIFGIIAVSAFMFASCGGNTTETQVEETTEPQTEEVVVEEECTQADTTMAATECENQEAQEATEVTE